MSEDTFYFVMGMVIAPLSVGAGILVFAAGGSSEAAWAVGLLLAGLGNLLLVVGVYKTGGLK